jgi:hypothetical protein
LSDDIDGGDECGTAKTLISVWSVGVPNCQPDALFFLFTLTYRYKEGYEEDYGLDSLRLHYGFVAQDYEKTMPDATYFDDESGKRKIDQTELMGHSQKLNGWFSWCGFKHTMSYCTQGAEFTTCKTTVSPEKYIGSIHGAAVVMVSFLNVRFS